MTGTAATPGSRPEGPGMLPAALREDFGSVDATLPRTARDWLVDLAVFVTSVLGGMIVFALNAWAEEEAGTAVDGLLFADLVTGALGCLLIWLRRRAPVHLAVILAPGTAYSSALIAAALIALFTVAVHRPVRTLVPVAALHLACGTAFIFVRPDPELPFLVNVVLTVAVLAAVIAWGMFVRARRRLVLSLRERARRAEAEQQARVAQARQTERTRIAREMHDVLAHRISLVSLHAGALEYRPDATPEEVSRAAGVIRAGAHEALQDLRTIIGVLRAGDDAAAGVPPERPQPTFADLPRLLDEWRAAGPVVTVTTEPGFGGYEAVPETLGRTAYRIVQEGLTNAGKHAPGQPVALRIGGAPGGELTLELRNRRAPGADTGIPGGGQGLAGLAERAELAGGTLDHGRTPAGDFRLRARLPWPA